MNLHRTSGQPDWDKVDSLSYNVFQKVASTTYGLITPANIISIIGLGLVIYGLIAILNDHFLFGLVLLAVGRLLDIIDGIVANATQTKSPLGELVDASIDKVGTLSTIVVLFIVDIAQWWVILALLIPQVIIPVVVFYKRQKGINIHPTRSGKLSMGLAWIGIVGLLLIKALGGAQALVVVVYSVIIASLLLGLYALWEYITGRD